MIISPQQFIDAGNSASSAAKASTTGDSLLATTATSVESGITPIAVPTSSSGPSPPNTTASPSQESTSLTASTLTSSTSVSSNSASSPTPSNTFSHSSAGATVILTTHPTQSSTLPQPSIIPCSDSTWIVNPQNWQAINVDKSLDDWWNDNVTSAEKGSNTFVGLLFNMSGDGTVQCGIGSDSTCALPSCQEFLDTGLPQWVYFAQVSVVEMSKLFDNMNQGMTTAEAQMDPLVTDMATIFPWQNPQTQLNSALPWIEAAVTSVLSFVPYVGLFFGDIAKQSELLGGIVTTAGEFAKGGLQQLQQQDPVDYMASGRFTVNYNSDPPDSTAIAQFYFQILVSQYANQQWLNNSKTFVMCTNATDVSCVEDSLYTDSNRSCCLYSLDNNAIYIDPLPGLPELANATYGIPPPNITASSLASYLAAQFAYQPSTFYSTLDTKALLDPSQQAFAQGASFQGVWTLPVCDVPASHASWVANYTADLLPCCCGVDCSETEAFFNASRLAGWGTVNSKCGTQYSGFVAISPARGRVRVGMGLLGAVGMLWVGMIWLF
ncbi:Mucin-21 [Xylographa trunciseda]|nr:Mucin-21 [Xylographa trunciseda]